MAETLPEGTDSIIEGAGTGGDADDAVSRFGDETTADTVGSRSGSGAPGGSASGGSTAGGGTSTGGGAGSDNGGDTSGGTSGESTGSGARPGSDASLSDRIQSLRGEATDRARDFATQGKDRLTGTLDEAVKMIDGVADQLDEKLGAQVGDQVRRASGAVSGFAETLKGQDIDSLLAQGADLVRRSPAAAVGVAAALGFVVARVVKAGGLSVGESRPGERGETGSGARGA